MIMESEARSESITGNRPVTYIVGNLLMCIMYGARKYAQLLRELYPHHATCVIQHLHMSLELN
jgi:hypothetical protein